MAPPSKSLLSNVSDHKGLPSAVLTSRAVIRTRSPTFRTLPSSTVRTLTCLPIAEAVSDRPLNRKSARGGATRRPGASTRAAVIAGYRRSSRMAKQLRRARVPPISSPSPEERGCHANDDRHPDRGRPPLRFRVPSGKGPRIPGLWLEGVTHCGAGLLAGNDGFRAGVSSSSRWPSKDMPARKPSWPARRPALHGESCPTFGSLENIV